MRISLSLGLQVGLVCALSSTFEAPVAGMTYSGVVDAGSTGTRLNIYGFVGGEIRHQGLFTNAPGLAVPKKDDEIKALIGELFTHAKPFYSNLSQIPVGFYGTSGFRTPDRQRSEHILQLVKSELKDYNLKEARVISGADEGKLALMALAISNKEQASHRSVGIVDMGGGSTQISVMERNGKVASESIDLGITSIGEDGLKGCNVHKDDEQESCARQIIAKLVDVPSKPGLNSVDDLYLLSYFHDELSKVVRNEATSMGEVKAEFYKRCKLLESHECRNLFYLISFMNTLGVEDTKAVRQIDTNNGINITWASGKAYELNKKYNTTTEVK